MAGLALLGVHESDDEPVIQSQFTICSNNHPLEPYWLLKTAPRQPTCIQETVLLKLSIYQRNVKCVKPDISMASSIWTERGYMMMMFLANPILYRAPYGAHKELEK